LIDRLNDLSQDVADRIDDIEQMEMELKNKDKIIDIMNKLLVDKQKVKHEMEYTAPKGDVLD